MPDGWGDGLPGFDGGFSPGDWGDGLPIISGGVAPQVVSAVALDTFTVRLVYDSEVNHANPANANDSLNPANYAFSGGLAAIAVVLHQASPTVVDITVDSYMLAILYTVTVSNVENGSGLVIDPAHNSATFLGISDQASDFMAEILVGDEVVWSAINEVPQQTLQIDVRHLIGTLPLTFRIRGLP